MSDLNQLETPGSFADLYIEPGRLKPSLSREQLFARYELCEDLASALSEQASGTMHELGVAESDVLERYYQGLNTEESGVSGLEAGWIIHRITEILQWPGQLARFVDPPGADREGDDLPG